MIVSRTIGYNIHRPCYNLLPINPVSSTLFREKSDQELSVIIEFISNGTIPFPPNELESIVRKFCMHPNISQSTLLKVKNILCGGNNANGFRLIDRVELASSAKYMSDDGIKQIMRRNLQAQGQDLYKDLNSESANILALLSTGALSMRQASMVFDHCIEMKTPQSLMLYKQALQEGFVQSEYIGKTVSELARKDASLADLPLSIFIKVCLSECTSHNRDHIFDLIVNNKFDNQSFRPSAYSAKDLGEDHLISMLSLATTDEKYKWFHTEQFGHQSLCNLRSDICTRLLNEHLYPRILIGCVIDQDILIDSIMGLREISAFDIDVWSKYGIKNIMELGEEKLHQFLDDKVYSGPLCEYFTTTILKEKALIGSDAGATILNMQKKSLGAYND